jgi:hypothetical protein
METNRVTAPRIPLLLPLLRHPSAVLLFIQLAGVLLYPWMEETPAGRMAFGAFGLVVPILTLYVVRRTPALDWIALLLGVPVMLLVVAQLIRFDPRLIVTAAVLEAAFYFYATGSLIAYMLQDTTATTDELFAAGATFTVLAWAFAYTYVVCQAVLPGSFTAPVDPEGPRTWMELLFLSFSLLSSVGVTDILPATPMARALVMLEMFAGVMYIALVVSRLIGLTVAARRERPGEA